MTLCVSVGRGRLTFHGGELADAVRISPSLRVSVIPASRTQSGFVATQGPRRHDRVGDAHSRV